MLADLFGDALLPQSHLPAFAAANPNVVLHNHERITWRTHNAVFQVTWRNGVYYGRTWEVVPGCEDDEDQCFAFVEDSVIETVVERLAHQWRSHFHIRRVKYENS